MASSENFFHFYFHSVQYFEWLCTFFYNFFWKGDFLSKKMFKRLFKSIQTFGKKLVIMSFYCLTRLTSLMGKLWQIFEWGLSKSVFFLSRILLWRPSKIKIGHPKARKYFHDADSHVFLALKFSSFFCIFL